MDAGELYEQELHDERMAIRKERDQLRIEVAALRAEVAELRAAGPRGFKRGDRIRHRVSKQLATVVHSTLTVTIDSLGPGRTFPWNPDNCDLEPAQARQEESCGHCGHWPSHEPICDCTCHTAEEPSNGE